MRKSVQSVHGVKYWCFRVGGFSAGFYPSSTKTKRGMRIEFKQWPSTKRGEAFVFHKPSV